jgi:2-alkyl-3-oxoalkanoate reductase
LLDCASYGHDCSLSGILDRPMKQSILVLGAGGFIGRAVMSGLAATHWAVPIAGIRRPTSADKTTERRIVEATSAESIAAAMQGVSAVVNCVAGSADTITSGASALIEAAGRTTPAPRIIHLSTMSVYGSAEGLLDESAPLRGDLGPYSEAKVAAEAIIAAYRHAVILRPGCVFGPGSEQWSVRIASLLCDHRLGDLGVAGDGCCNLVDVGDVVFAIMRALEDPTTDGRVFNLAVAPAPTWNEFLSRYAIALRAVPVRRIPGRRLRIETKLLAPPLKVAEILARAARINRRLPPPIPSSLLRLMGQDIRLDSRAAESALGIVWEDLDASITGTARWFAEQVRRSA